MRSVRSLRMFCVVVPPCLLGVTACSLFDARPVEATAQPVSASATPSRRITQLEFGSSARYANCSEPACPSTTPKTLAVASVPTSPVAVSTQAPAPVMTSVAERPQPTVNVGSVRKPTVLALSFASDSAALTQSHKAQLLSLVPAFNKAERVLILGRTDDVGTGGANEAIALARATAVRDHLRRVAPTLPKDVRIDARGLCCYAATNDTPEGRAQNRRVEVVFTAANEVRP